MCHILLVSGNIDTAGGNEERLLERRSGYLLSFRLFELLLISLFCIFIIRCIKFNLIYINLLDLLVELVEFSINFVLIFIDCN